MTLKESLANLIADFAGMNKTPDFKPTNATLKDPSSEPHQHLYQRNQRSTLNSSTSPHYAQHRRKSVQIIIGAEELPVLNSQRSGSDVSPTSGNPDKYVKGQRRCSAPCLETHANLIKLKKQWRKLSDSGESSISEEEEEKTPTHEPLTYRV
ncbi:unnamed protein product [Auanema sp. JU1783]|nr:unnamed protein product [Auanema sp. JU1783]